MIFYPSLSSITWSSYLVVAGSILVRGISLILAIEPDSSVLRSGGESEVWQLRREVGRQQNVPGRQVAVDDVPRVQVVHALGNLETPV